MKVKEPPLGVMPRWLWDEQNPEPNLEDEVTRHAEVLDAAQRYREAGLPADPKWLAELGVQPPRS